MVTSSSKITSKNIVDGEAKLLPKISVSVITLAKNEEKLIGQCIRSAAWADEHIVLDSGSTDQTGEIATSLGATVYEQEWLGWSAQRNKGIDLAKHDWVFFLEADEIVTDELATAIKNVMLDSPNPNNGYCVNRRDLMYGKLLPNMQRNSKIMTFVRLFNRRYSAYDLSVLVHETVLCPGETILLSGILIHARGYNVYGHVNNFNKYAEIEARMLIAQGAKSSAFLILFRPISRFVWCYLIKGACAYGVAGLNFSLAKAISEYVRYAKLWELQNLGDEH